METNYKNKKRFPVASALFLIYVVVSMASNIFCAVIKISLLSWLEEISSDIYGGGLFSSLVLITGELENLLTTTMILLIIAAIVGAIAYILIAIFTFKTDKKPSIVYIAAIPFASIAAAVSAISAIIALSPRENEYYILANVFDLSAQLMLILTLISVLIFTILIKAFKKPSKLSGLWFISAAPGFLYLIMVVLSKIFECLNFYNINAILLDTEPFNTLSYFWFIQSITRFLGATILVIAFFCVAHQFARVNKKLSC